MSLELFHPAVANWFKASFEQVSLVQQQAWPSIQSNKNTLIAAPTGSGKTLAAFLAAIDELLKLGIEGKLLNTTQVLYISPLKALSNDIEKNLKLPLNGIRDALLEMGQDDISLTAAVRTGDTPAYERSKMIKKPPHILVTTPESLYLLLSSNSGRNILSTVRTVIIDEIHSLAGNKRGAHLSLSLQRLDALCFYHCATKATRIGISATQKPIELMAKFLVGKSQFCNIIDVGHKRQRDLALVLTSSPLDAIMSNEAWDEIYDQLVLYSEQHRTILVFVNTRRLAERAAHHLSDRIGEEFVTAHHGSLSRQHRLDAENRLKNGDLRILFATASLELGIDIGDIDLVVQLGSPRSIATFLQRVGRSGHTLSAIPKGRLFPTSRDDLVECAALLYSIKNDELDKILIPSHPLDVLAQQIVAEVANRDWPEQELFELFKSAYPYQTLTPEIFSQVVKMLADGYSTRRGRRSAYLHRDQVNGMLRARRSARLVALTNAGAIPDQFDYTVILQPCGSVIGNLNEEFAFESIPGDIFQLGNTSYRMLKIEQGKVYVEDAHGQPPNIPFWFGEAPGRTNELSFAVSRLREFYSDNIKKGFDYCKQQLITIYNLDDSAAQQLSDYLFAAYTAFGDILPNQKQIIFERFFDETGDMHLVIHSTFGSRINRAWGLSLRKRFCRKFNFELQAAATDDNIVLSLGPTHSFPLDEVQYYLHSNSVKEILIQALLDAPMFATQWRWNCNISLAVPRNRNGKRVPAQFQRNNAEDLIAVIFPDQIACLENITGQREVPQHPLVDQTLDDCLFQRMDIDGLIILLSAIQQQKINIVCCDLTSPSPLANEIINARTYAFLDDVPAEERRTLAIQRRAAQDPTSANDLGILNPETIRVVQQEAWPSPRDADELHDALLVMGFLTETECLIGPNHFEHSSLYSLQHFFEILIAQNRATRVYISNNNDQCLWVSAERLSEILSLYHDVQYQPRIKIISDSDTNNNSDKNAEENLIDIIRSRLEGVGPISSAQLAQALLLDEYKIEQALLALEQQGFVIRGEFYKDNLSNNSKSKTQWCERGLLARIHRYSLKKLRAEIEPVSAAQLMVFLFHWQRLDDPLEGKQALSFVINQLEGVAIAAQSWEKTVIPARLADFSPHWLDQLCTSGYLSWLRLSTTITKNQDTRFLAPLKSTTINLIPREHLDNWMPASKDYNDIARSSDAQKCFELLNSKGALFFNDIVSSVGLLRTQVENALGELVIRGEVSSDSFSGLRTLIKPIKNKSSFSNRRINRLLSENRIDDAGRWALINTNNKSNKFSENQIEHIAETLLLRYGVVFRKIIDKENNLPSWRELLYCYHRLEARGEVRGGRFVAGFSGQQFALKEAVSSLRQLNRQENNKDQLITISGADPLNLTGLITPGERIAAVQTNKILYENGIVIAYSLNGTVHFNGDFNSQRKIQLKNYLSNLHYTQYSNIK